MLVKSHGTSSYFDKKTKELKTTVGPLYIHFSEECLKNYDDEFYGAGESFDFSKIKIDAKAKKKLNNADIELLANLGVPV